MVANLKQASKMKMKRLDEFDKDDWLLVARKAKPDLTEAEYEDMWRRYTELKRSKDAN